jgi:putative sigma-54 modulation protein
MNITITFRQMTASPALTEHVHEKVAKLQRFLRQPMSAKATLSVDRLKHVAEVRISSGGQHLEAKEANLDMYTSVDKVIEKLERQIRGMKGTKESKARRGGVTLRDGSSLPPEPSPRDAVPETVKVSIKTQPARTRRAMLSTSAGRSRALPTKAR